MLYYIIILQSDDIRYIDVIVDICFVHDLWWIWWILTSGGVLRTYHHFGQPHGMSCSNPCRRNSAHPEIVQIVTKQAPFQQVQTATTSLLCLTRKVGKPVITPSKSCISMQWKIISLTDTHGIHVRQLESSTAQPGWRNGQRIGPGLGPETWYSGFVKFFPGRLTDGHMIW